MFRVLKVSNREGEYICSAQSGNLRNLEIALGILEILRLCRQSWDCVTRVRDLKIE